MSICCNRQKGEIRELIKREQIQFVTALNGLNPWLDDSTTDLLLLANIYWSMLSYLLEYVIIFIWICHDIYWSIISYLLEYVTIFIGVCYHIYWNMSPYLLEYVIYWNMSPYLLEYVVIIFIGIYHHINWRMLY